MSETPHTSPFDAIRRIDEHGNEYWSARELYKLLGYSTWQRFQHAIEQAKKSCQESGQAVSAHFNINVKIVKAGATTKPREDYKLSRYACYVMRMIYSAQSVTSTILPRRYNNSNSPSSHLLNRKSARCVMCVIFARRKRLLEQCDSKSWVKRWPRTSTGTYPSCQQSWRS